MNFLSSLQGVLMYARSRAGAPEKRISFLYHLAGQKHTSGSIRPFPWIGAKDCRGGLLRDFCSRRRICVPPTSADNLRPHMTALMDTVLPLNLKKQPF
ncbi:hypothetical protein AVEN_176213-1 [Araneus ventricosus]|uniref:Uncharacterized protein n=1 Tax=Araneus ventricosus TaxID=182803 RepID=A0A4Y2X426_ARAVE|nr:hypothetical protein AVEN_176213-1 [Araneus ventricosus]